MLESAFAYYIGGKIYTWKQPSPEELQESSSSIGKVVAETTKEVAISKANKDRLHDLALGLDVFEHSPQESNRE